MVVDLSHAQILERQRPQFGQGIIDADIGAGDLLQQTTKSF